MQIERLSSRKKADKLIRKVEKMLSGPLDIFGENLTYFTTTQNLSYLNQYVKESMDSACVVLGSGDNVFQLLSMGITDITAVDNNELQSLVYALKKAAIKTIDLSCYEDFILDSSTDKYLSYDIYKEVRYGFEESEKTEQLFWDEVLKNHHKSELMYQFVKCGLESVSLDAVRKSMSYTKKKSHYRTVRDNLKKATLSIQTGDMIDFLEKTDKVFDLVDITNILIFVYQELDCNDSLFSERLKTIKKAYEGNLSKDGIFVLDYIFNTRKDEFENGTFNPATRIGEILGKIRNQVLKVFPNVFPDEIEALIERAYFVDKNNTTDTILYLKN